MFGPGLIGFFFHRSAVAGGEQQTENWTSRFIALLPSEEKQIGKGAEERAPQATRHFGLQGRRRHMPNVNVVAAEWLLVVFVPAAGRPGPVRVRVEGVEPKDKPMAKALANVAAVWLAARRLA